MTWALIAAEIKTLTEAVAGVVNVYTRKVQYDDPDDFDSKFKDAANGNRAFGIEITQAAIMSQDRDNYSTIRTTRLASIHLFIGLYEEQGIADSEISYNQVDAMAELLQVKYRTNRQVNGTALKSQLPTAGEIVPELRSDVYCWAVDIRWEIQERTID